MIEFKLRVGAVGTTIVTFGGADTVENCGNLNNGKTSICLRDEINETYNRLGRKTDWETEKYQK